MYHHPYPEIPKLSAQFIGWRVWSFARSRLEWQLNSSPDQWLSIGATIQEYTIGRSKKYTWWQHLAWPLVVDSSPIAANGEERPKPNKVTLPHQPSRLARNLSMQNNPVHKYNGREIQQLEYSEIRVELPLSGPSSADKYCTRDACARLLTAYIFLTSCSKLDSNVCPACSYLWPQIASLVEHLFHSLSLDIIWICSF